MPRKSGSAASKKSKTTKRSTPPKPVAGQGSSDPKDAAIAAEVAAFFAEFEQEQAKDLEGAWLAGFYNPLEDVPRLRKRPLTLVEQDWLVAAWDREWLLGEDGKESLYYTAPPPKFNPKQADWYLRPDMTEFLDEPMLLSEAIKKYPIS
ncbi:hypothetical protein ACN4EK_30595 [Pantanalinema rosaneae CENA516]|uniref:hypothetical protein n=1 Tax=Pantanalinema rosaneae TaxID=1620701 RepID=UPI003D6F2360